MRLDYQILLKSPPISSLTGSAPAMKPSSPLDRGVQKGWGKGGDGPGHPKSKITKNIILQLNAFLIVKLPTHAAWT